MGDLYAYCCRQFFPLDPELFWRQVSLVELNKMLKFISCSQTYLQHALDSAIVIPLMTPGTPENHVVCAAFEEQQSILNSTLLKPQVFIYLMLGNFQGLFLRKILHNISSLFFHSSFQLLLVYWCVIQTIEVNKMTFPDFAGASVRAWEPKLDASRFICVYNI